MCGNRCPTAPAPHGLHSAVALSHEEEAAVSAVDGHDDLDRGAADLGCAR